KNPQTRRTRSIFVVGVDPSADLLELPELTPDKLEEIKKADVVLFDRRSRSEFGPIPEWFESGREVFTEVGNRRVQVGGLFEMGATFGADGTILTSDLNFLRIFPQRERGLVDIGVVQLQPGVDPQPLVQQMRAFLPEDVRVLSRAEFIDMEQSYWEEGTAIGFIFGLGVAMGFIVGIVIVYQILYTDVSDHLAEYATLKAMGYTDTYLLGVVFQEAILLAGLGYIPAFALAVLLYDLTANATLLPIAMTFSRAVLVLLLTVSMCFISGAIAVRRLRAADPADIF
ncbi:ABC transporter permease DevC, partial [Synechococcus sp. OH2]